MPGKVVHLPEETHATMVAFCKANHIKASQWVEGLIYAATGGEPVLPQPAPIEQTKKVEPVKKKKLPTETVIPASEDSQKPWERPPFWKQNA